LAEVGGARSHSCFDPVNEVTPPIPDGPTADMDIGRPIAANPTSLKEPGREFQQFGCFGFCEQGRWIVMGHHAPPRDLLVVGVYLYQIKRNKKGAKFDPYQSYYFKSTMFYKYILNS
jgi:hypothetical protein